MVGRATASTEMSTATRRVGSARTARARMARVRVEIRSVFMPLGRTGGPGFDIAPKKEFAHRLQLGKESPDRDAFSAPVQDHGIATRPPVAGRSLARPRCVVRG